MKFTPADVRQVVRENVAKDGREVTPGVIAHQDAGDVMRHHGPCYVAVHHGVTQGLVWRESTVDAGGREVSVRWRGIRPGSRGPVLREGATRLEMAGYL